MNQPPGSPASATTRGEWWMQHAGAAARVAWNRGEKPHRGAVKPNQIKSGRSRANA